MSDTDHHWASIETAPKDAERLLLYAEREADDLTPQIGRWLEGRWVMCWDHTPMDGTDCNGTRWMPPTHWTTLPEPPPTKSRGS